MAAPGAASDGQARHKRAELERLLDHLETCIRKKLPPLITMLAQGSKGETASLIRKDITAIRALISRINPEVMRWGLTAERLRYQNLVHNFDAQMRSAELRQQEKERRGSSRIELDLPVTVNQGQASQRARALNMNQVGDTVQLDLDEEVPVRRVKGKVVWSRDYEEGGYAAGVKFLSLETEKKDLLRRFLQEEQDKRTGCQPRLAEVKKPKVQA
jgi:hypothetical protein